MVKVLNIMLSRGLGGIQQAFLDYSIALQNQSIEVVNVISFRAEIARELGGPRYRLINLGLWDPVSITHLAYIISKEKPDMIIAHGNRAINLCHILKNINLPLIGVTHNYSTKWILKCDYALALTKDLKANLIASGFPEDRIRLLSNMVKPHCFPRTSLQATIRGSCEDRLLRPSDQVRGKKPLPTIGVMGRLIPKKGFDIFLMALSLMRKRGCQFKAVIGGLGEELSRLEQMRDKLALQDSVDFLGWVENRQDFFDQIDIFCLPSKHEPFGILLLEAMAHGKPIVSTNAEGPSEILQDRVDGLLTDITPIGLAEGMMELVSNPELTQSLAKNAILSIKTKYDIKIVGKILGNIINDIQSNKAK